MRAYMRRKRWVLSLALSFIFVFWGVWGAEAAQYVYDEANRLRWVEYGNGKVVGHAYDGEGNRTQTLINETPSAGVSVSSAWHDFGIKTTGDSGVQTFTIYNNSSSELTGVTISLGDQGAGFSLTNNCSGTIGAMSSCTFSITFAPGVQGLKGTYVSVASDQSTSKILLGGEGTTVLPFRAIRINGGAEFTNTDSVTLSLSAPSYPTDITQMCVSNTASCSSWEGVSSSKQWTLSSGDGNKVVYAQFRNALGVVSDIYYDSIALESQFPTGTIVINGGASFTYSGFVSLALSASDASGSGMDQMRFSNDGSTWSDWEPYATSQSRTLTSGNGVKTVYVQYKDNAGNTSISYSDSILVTYKRIVDFDGDNVSDLSYWRPSDGYWWIINSSDESVTARQWGLGSLSDVPVPGDYDGDGKTDYAVWRADGGTWWVIYSHDESFASRQWGNGSLGDIPVPGDYDGDGKSDYAIWRPGDGNWWILNSSDQSVTTQAWGGGAFNDIPVPGDYDGDGITDLAVYRQDTGGWFIIPSGGGPSYAEGWGGNPNDIPVPGDYDGDGKADPAFLRPENGTWNILRSSDQGTTVIQWGESGDIPLY